MKDTKARKMFKKYPTFFMQMYMHSLKEDPKHPDDNGVIYSKVMANIANPGTYWMPKVKNIDQILEDFKNA